MTAEGRDAEQLQVESHMRICLNIVPEADAMYTVAPSEPALIEAAAQVMQGKSGRENSVDILERFMSNRYLSKGDRGELACMLLMLLAHDEACDALRGRDGIRLMMPYHVPLRLTEFLTTLFAGNYRTEILEAQAIEGGTSLQQTFKDAWVHFTHFVKVHDHKVVDRKFLMRLMARGAAVLCADNQLGIDAIVPVCYKGTELTPTNMTCILVQGKNVHDLVNSRPVLFANMDPFYVGVYEKGAKDCPPVIKIVLSVGTERPSFTCTPAPPERPTREAKQPPSISPEHFEFFAAGMSHEVFGPVQKRQEAIWRNLVSRSGVEDIYAPGTNDSILDVVRCMTPCMQSHVRHWDAFFPLNKS